MITDKVQDLFIIDLQGIIIYVGFSDISTSTVDLSN